MTETTLCYLEKDGCYLMLYRNKKENDLNEGKWIGVGGKIEGRETPEEGARREILEETGLYARELKLRAVITFLSDRWNDERMYLFTSSDFEGTLKECDEGELLWVPVEKVLSLPSWEGDRLFLDRIKNPEQEYFSLSLDYMGDVLQHAVLWENGRETVIK